MSRLDELIQQYCPDGVEYRKLDSGDAKSLVKIETGKLNANAAVIDGEFAFFTTAKEISRIDRYRWDCEALLVAGNANVGDVKYYKGKFEAYQRTYVLTNFHTDIKPKYLYYVLMNNLKDYLESHKNNGAMIYIVLGTLQNFEIPVPPLPVQEEIVRILDKFTELEQELEQELELRKKQYEYYRNKMLSLSDYDGEVEEISLATCLYYEQPTKYLVRDTTYSDEYDTPVLTAGQTFILGYTNEKDGIYKASKENPVIIFDDFTTASKWVDFDFKVKSSAMKMLKSSNTAKYNIRYMFYCMENIEYTPIDHARQWISKYGTFNVRIPNITEQKRIVDVLDKFSTLTSDISEGLPAEIKMRHQQYEYYRDKLLNFKRLEVA